jgi:hypothetical protein
VYVPACGSGSGAGQAADVTPAVVETLTWHKVAVCVVPFKAQEKVNVPVPSVLGVVVPGTAEVTVAANVTVWSVAEVVTAGAGEVNATVVAVGATLTLTAGSVDVSNGSELPVPGVKAAVMVWVPAEENVSVQAGMMPEAGTTTFVQLALIELPLSE